MLTLTHPTLASLLEAVRADPADDTVRLALADYLENPDEGNDTAWAELIRVQVSLTHPKYWTNAGRERKQRTKRLRARESALLREHEPRLRRGEKCERCENGTYTFFPSTSHPPRKKTCPFCHGTGWSRWWFSELLPLVDLTPTTIAHGPQNRDFVHRVHFERGFPVQVDANLADIMDEDGKATEWALAVVRGEPGLRRLWPMDYPAYESRPGMWFVGGSPRMGRANLPGNLLSMLFRKGGHYSVSESAANRALATAAWQCVREQA